MRLNLQMTYGDAKDGLAEWLRDAVLRIRSIVDEAHLGFGDGVAVDNIYGRWLPIELPAIANTEMIANHDLGTIPVGYIVVRRDKAGVVYDGVTPWTTTQISLKSNQASLVALIFVLGPSNQAF